MGLWIVLKRLNVLILELGQSNAALHYPYHDPVMNDAMQHWHFHSIQSKFQQKQCDTNSNLTLTAEEAELLEKQSGILSVMPELRYELHTTRTPQFLGMLGGINEAVFPASEKLSKVIIGVVDTGVWPEIKSYDDKGLGPVPRSWRGQCEEGKNFNSSSCNRKLIGARFFPKGFEASILGPIDEKVESRSPRDVDGHGTHASTIAAGSAVPGASLFGYASGTARGIATQARVATYIRLAGLYEDLYTDFIAIGAFSAMAKGVFVSCSAGSRGPESDSTSNNAPWITTVGAGTLDRDFPAYVSLGNGKKYRGASIYSGTPLSSGLHPLVYARNASNSTSDQCAPDSLIPEKVVGKIVVCDQGGTNRLDKSMVVKKAGGMGMILADTEGYDEEQLVVDSYVLPVVVSWVSNPHRWWQHSLVWGTPATYKVSVPTQTPSVKILVEPKSLSFTRPYEKKTYTVTFVASPMTSRTNSFGRLEWSDGKHIVSSPIAIFWY
ncbi:unnamed protein product [Prunus armeniaca]|uniref:Subtilisin-like protease fibronectin type-III domain-containing protein n=1 Tax=Prunus armeniaca TaxID=36596 RepID=A0A6J5TT93_PRUAR|nr:unnamed protein product [Prunus armeniaca]